MTLIDLERLGARNQIFQVDLNDAVLGRPHHCICTNASRSLSATAEFLVSVDDDADSNVSSF